jgi:hypothetical protein
VLKDVTNALRVLEPGGTIVMHDCNPQHEASAHHETPPPASFWNGDVWKAFVRLRAFPCVAGPAPVGLWVMLGSDGHCLLVGPHFAAVSRRAWWMWMRGWGW